MTVVRLREVKYKLNAVQQAVELAIVIIRLKGFLHQYKPHYLSFTRELYSVLIKFYQ
jgi:hypothetical protein